MNARTRLRTGAAALVVTTVALATGTAHAAVDLGPPQLASATSDGVSGDGWSSGAGMSADGRYVAFASEASNLVPDDTNTKTDVFTRDLADQTMQRVSVDGQGQQLATSSWAGSMSADGRLVLFTTEVPNDGSVRYQLRLWDRAVGTSSPIPETSKAGRPLNMGSAVLSGNGRYVVFVTTEPLVRGDRDLHSDVYRLDLATRAVRRVTVTPLARPVRDLTGAPSVSHSGRFIAFETTARLVKRDRAQSTRRTARDIYVRDMERRNPRLVTVSSAGVQANYDSIGAGVSAGGRYVVFSSMATNLVRRDTNGDWDVFIRDLRKGITQRVSVDSREQQGNRHSQGPMFGGPSITRDGRYVVFSSLATNLAPNSFPRVDPENGGNVFVRDRRAGTTTTVSATASQEPANDISYVGAISTDGSLIAFTSDATNLDEGDSSYYTDVFVRTVDHGR